MGTGRPLTTFDLKRFNAVRGYQAQQGREISRCLKELRALRKEGLAECTDEPEDSAENEPGSPQPPANDDAPEQAEKAVPTAQEPSRNEPSRRPPMASSGRSTACRCSTCGGGRAGIRWPRPGQAAARRRLPARGAWPGDAAEAGSGQTALRPIRGRPAARAVRGAARGVAGRHLRGYALATQHL